MEHRNIGSLRVSVVAVGCTTIGRELDESQSATLVHAAIDEGITFFDTADVYGTPANQSELFLGAALQGRRDEVVLATKFGSRLVDGVQQGGAGSPAEVRKRVEASLIRLRTDRIDLIQLHRPDPETPIGDTLGALNELVIEGKVVEFGASNFSVAQLREAEAVGGKGFVSLQNEYNLLHRDDEGDVIPECERLGISYVPWFPLANGMLTGKYRRGADAPEGARLTEVPERREVFMTDRNLDIVEDLIAYAEAHGRTPLELAFGWLLAMKSVPCIIAGMRTVEQVKSNVSSVGWKLTRQEIDEIGALAPQQ